jgi:uncharacterized membrane protein
MLPQLITLALIGQAQAYAQEIRDTPMMRMEKCFGIVKAGYNDCANASGTHACAGYATKEKEAGEWIAVPKGTCERLVGGSLTPKK